MTKIKLCGMSRDEDILAANALLPDYIGFILYFEKSRRNVSPETARRLKRLLSPEIRAVGVFVDAPLDAVAELLEDRTIDLAQLHGSEDENYIAALKARTGSPVVKAFKATEPEARRRAEESGADLVLLDSGKGYGISYDFRITKDMKRPYFLAGGITIENVADAIRAVRPYAVDISSGIETDGKKDPEKMADFVRRVREADQKLEGEKEP